MPTGPAAGRWQGGGLPMVFLDVDGTLLPLRGACLPGTLDGWNTRWQNAANPQLALIDRALGPRLLALGAELVWATAWMSDANQVIAPILGLPCLPVADMGPLPGVDDPVPTESDPGADVGWKTAALVELAAGRPFVWIDDEISKVDRAWVAVHHPGRAWLVRVDSARGLMDADLSLVERWLSTIHPSAGAGITSCGSDQAGWPATSCPAAR